MAKKIQYRSVDVEQVSTGTVLERLAGQPRVAVGIDVAKRNFVAAVCDGTGDTQVRVRFEHPRQTTRFVELLKELQDAGCTVEVAMEPTGTYGDALRYQLGTRSIPVYRVTNKHVADAAEVFDGSPSKHDGKDASVIGWLHVQKRSKPWPELDATRRSVRALVAQRELYDEPLRKLIAQMEPLLARHFPELERLFDLSRRKTPYRLLEVFGSPSALARAGVSRVAELMKKFSRRTPDAELVQGLVDTARTTSGTPMVSEEADLIRRMAKEVLHLMALRDELDARIESATADVPAIAATRFLGPVTAAVIYAYLGDPRDYQSAAAYEKAAGLNLVESSSGTDPRAPDKVHRHISKRGAGVVRKYLFLAAMRAVHTDPICKAWYQKRRSFSAEERLKAIVAVERKLCRALFHVAQGQPFDAKKLFDARRLGAEPTTTEVA
jgi:transposase